VFIKHIVKLKNFILVFIIFAILFSNYFILIFNINFIKYLDEVLVLLFFLHISSIRRVNYYTISIYIALIYFIGISLFFEVNSTFNIVIQSIIHLKFFIFIDVINEYFSRQLIVRIIKYLFIISLVGFLWNLFFPSFFSISLSSPQDIDLESSKIGGFQLSINNLAFTFLFIYIYRLHNLGRDTKKIIFYSLFFLIILLLIGSRTAILGLFMTVFSLLQYKQKKYKLISNFFYIISVLLLLFFIQDSTIITRTLNNISMISSDSGYIRGIMIASSLILFLQHFPFGSGAATFGSALSTNSKVYQQLGLDNLSFFIEMRGVFDSNWASIIGEFGFLGLLIFLMLLYRAFKYINLNSNNESKKFVVLIFLLAIITGLTKPVFMQAYLSLIFALILVYFKKLNLKNYNEDTYCE
jgi:O-antigen ligase